MQGLHFIGGVLDGWTEPLRPEEVDNLPDAIKPTISARRSQVSDLHGLEVVLDKIHDPKRVKPVYRRRRDGCYHVV